MERNRKYIFFFLETHLLNWSFLTKRFFSKSRAENSRLSLLIWPTRLTGCYKPNFYLYRSTFCGKLIESSRMISHVCSGFSRQCGVQHNIYIRLLSFLSWKFWPKRWHCPYRWWSLLARLITLFKKKVRPRRTLPQRRWRRRRRRRQTKKDADKQKKDAELFKETKPFALTCATQTVIIMSQRRLSGCTSVL